MGLEIPWGVVAAYAGGLAALYIVGKVFALPLKWLLKLVGNALIGGVALVLINAVGGLWGFHIGVNVFTALTVGVLGVPGVFLLILLHFIL
nr:pro-sigmaK processing inhibitor BofA family protein [bacterium]